MPITNSDITDKQNRAKELAKGLRELADKVEKMELELSISTHFSRPICVDPIKGEYKSSNNFITVITNFNRVPEILNDTIKQFFDWNSWV